MTYLFVDNGVVYGPERSDAKFANGHGDIPVSCIGVLVDLLLFD